MSVRATTILNSQNLPTATTRPVSTTVLGTVAPVAVFEEGNGGIRVQGNYLESVSASGRVLEKIALPANWEQELEEYQICDRFRQTMWCLGRPFSHQIRLVVDWKQNGFECAGEMYVPDLTPLPFSWEVLVSYDIAYFEETPGYQFDVAFPWAKLHDARDIVLRRRIAEAIEKFVCAGKGAFKVSKRDSLEVHVHNLFEGRPNALNKPALAGCWPDIYAARKSGRTRY